MIRLLTLVMVASFAVVFFCLGVSMWKAKLSRNEAWAINPKVLAADGFVSAAILGALAAWMIRGF